MSETVKVLAVGDPAVAAYTDPTTGFLAKAGALLPRLEFDVLPWVDYGVRLEAERASPTPSYDIVMIAGHLWLQDWAESGALATLDEGIAGFGPAYRFEDILPAVRKELSHGGHTYLLPSFTDGHLVFCDAQAAKSLPGGALPERVGTHWLRDAAKRLSGSGPALILKAHPSEIFLDWLPYLLEEGVEPFDPAGRPSFNNPRGHEALRRYLSMREYALGDSSSAGNEAVAEALSGGQAKIAVSWGGQAAVIAGRDPARFAYASLQRPWNVVWSFGLLAKSSRKAQALEALKALTSAEADRAVGVMAGSPVRASTYNDRDLAAACPWFPAQRRLVESAYALPRFTKLGASMGPLYARIADAFAGKLEAEAALAQAEAEILAL